MSVVVQQLSRNFDEQVAVDAISFEVSKGQVVGFLGPNGAGKSTTMRMITGYLQPTAGLARVCDFDAATHPMDVQRRLGYLPEHNPLYKDLYVPEFLSFAARLHHIPSSKRKARIEEMIEVTGLGKERRKQIGQLSKGYRQRVGLAQAMIHDPEVLILDEPTSGLDPNQLSDIRELIRSLGQNKTVILSTHIMQEVQALCDRVLIINNGKLVADDTTDALQQGQQGRVLRVKFKTPPPADFTKSLPGSPSQRREGDAWLISGNLPSLNEDIFHAAVAQNLVILSMEEVRQSLEDVFRRLTAENPVAS